MKKVLAMLALLSMTCGATEILSEYYVMEKVLPLLTEAESYTINGEEVKAIKVSNKVLKALSTTDDPFYYYNSAKEKKMVRTHILFLCISFYIFCMLCIDAYKIFTSK